MNQHQNIVEKSLTDLKPQQLEQNQTYIDHNYINNVTVQTQVVAENIAVNGDGWQEVGAKTKKRSVTTYVDQSEKRSKVEVSSAHAVNLKLSNSFYPLSQDNNDNIADDVDPNDTRQEPSKEPKPPPIFIPNVTNVVPMVQAIEAMVGQDGYTYKCLNNKKVKILPVNAESYRNIVKGLTNLKIDFHTYQLKQERAYRIVLKNMHFSTPTDYIKAAIEQYGHQVRNISNLRHNVTKEPLSIFFIDLEPHIDNKTIYEINYLLNARIRFEPPNKKREVVQCKKCQRYGHTRSYCWNQPRCVKCSLDHETSQCTKTSSTPPKCVHCEGEHPASYRGCKVYKELQLKHFPPLRKKDPTTDAVVDTVNDTAKVNYVPNTSTNVRLSSPANSNTSCSYANVVKNGNNNAESNTLTETSIMIQKSFEKFENILMKQAEQIGTLLNLLTVVLNKIK